MKKLIMCVDAILSACALNAATVNWGLANLFDADGNSLVGTITLASGSYSSVATISDYAADGSFSGFDWGTDPFATGSSWTLTAKVQDVNGDLYEKVFAYNLGTVDTSDTRAAGDMFQGQLDDILVNDFLPAGVLDITDLASDGWTAAGGGGGGGGTGGVPEPTSGLLLALGGAMLALRRRRA